jgi:hypothetical protein
MSADTQSTPAPVAGERGSAVPPELEQLVEIATLIGSARDAMSDEMVARLARAISEVATLLDRLTRNEALLHLLRTLERPEGQRLLFGLSRSLSLTSGKIAALPPASGGIAGLWSLAREPGVQDALRSLTVLRQCWVESMREPG